MNRVKLGVLALLPSALFIGVGLLMGYEGLFFASLVLLIVLAVPYWLADKIVLKTCGAELLTVHQSPTLFAMIEVVSKRAGVPMPRVYVIPGESPNICSIGHSRRSSGVVVTEGLLKALGPDELRCAIAHELVHIYFNDTLVGAIAATLTGMLGMSSNKARSEAAISSSHVGSEELAAFSGIRAVTAPLAATIVHFLVSPRREFRADRYAAMLLGTPSAMANAIRVMEKKKNLLSFDVPPSVAHLFLVSPLRHSRIATMFAVHPPLQERVQRLERLTQSVSQKQPVVS